MTQPDDALRFLFIDDNAHMQTRTLKRTMEQALRTLRPTASIAWDVCEDRLDGIDLLRSTDRIDVVLVDVIWSTIMGRDGAQGTDGARDLLEAALQRDDTVTILISDEAPTLLEYQDSTSLAAYRPHAVLAKAPAGSSNTYAAGALLSGFSSARRPFWSRGVDIAWALVDGSEELKASSLRLVCEEFACMTAMSQPAKVTLTTLGGGLSDTITMLVETQSSTTGGRTQQYMLKIAQDPRVLRDEIRNHDRLGYFPGTLFARFTGPPSRHAGWQGLKIDAVDGHTMSALGTEAIGKWSRVFGPDLLGKYVGNAQHIHADPAHILTGPSGALAPARWDRLTGAANASLGDSLLARLRAVPPADQLAGMQRSTATTVVHGDLHSRNVMIRSDGAAVFIDAASIDLDGLWCADPARLAVWIVCENLQREADYDADPARAVDVLGSALALTDKVAGTPHWTAQLRANIENTQERFDELWHAARHEVDVQADWHVMVRAELLRVAYTSRVFEAPTRRAAAELALRDAP